MEKQGYLRSDFDGEKPPIRTDSSFDLFDADEHDYEYLRTLLEDPDSEENEKSEAERLPEATEDKSY